MIVLLAVPILEIFCARHSLIKKVLTYKIVNFQVENSLKGCFVFIKLLFLYCEKTIIGFREYTGEVFCNSFALS
jgi:hypothetical protein